MVRQETERAIREEIAFLGKKRDTLIGRRRRLDGQITSLASQIKQLEAVLPQEQATPPTERTRAPRRPGLRPTGYTLLGTHYRTSTFKSVLVGVCTTLYELTSTDFRKVLTDGLTRRYFSEDYRERENGGELRKPESIGNSGIYVETNLNSGLALHLCKTVMGLVGLDDGDFAIETPES